jgi:putative membrane protein
MKLIVRWVISACALFVAAWLVPGIRVTGNAWLSFAGMAAILGLVNAVVRPILKALTCPLIVLTLGLFLFVINALMLLLAAWIGKALHLGFQIDGFGAALVGAVIVTVVTWVLSVFVPDSDKHD